MSSTVVKVLDEQHVFIAPHRDISERRKIVGAPVRRGMVMGGCHKETDDGRTV